MTAVLLPHSVQYMAIADSVLVVIAVWTLAEMLYKALLSLRQPGIKQTESFRGTLTSLAGREGWHLHINHCVIANDQGWFQQIIPVAPVPCL